MNALVCPECGSGDWELVEELDEVVVCNAPECGSECCLSDLVPWNQWKPEA